jgi:[ribosomal protein S18]-alanine N-acetyltransferase
MTARNWTIVPATLGSLSEILEVEEACFSAPWTRKMLEAELSGNPFAHFLVARQEGGNEAASESIVGYLCYWIVFEEVRLMNLAVIESMRHLGIAKSLVATALQRGMSQSAHRAVLEVRASNLAAQRLYEGFGFSRTAIRPKYYANPEEDAVLMELDPIVVKSSGSLCHDEGGHPPPQ